MLSPLSAGSQPFVVRTLKTLFYNSAISVPVQWLQHRFEESDNEKFYLCFMHLQTGFTFLPLFRIASRLSFPYHNARRAS
jgi:hypothetical protein